MSLEEGQKTFSKAETVMAIIYTIQNGTQWAEKRGIGVSGAWREQPPERRSLGKLSAFCNSEYICWEPVVCEAPTKAHRSQERTQRHSCHRSPSSHSLSLACGQLPPVPRIPRSPSSLQHVPFLFSTPTSRDTLLLLCRSSMSTSHLLLSRLGLVTALFSLPLGHRAQGSWTTSFQLRCAKQDTKQPKCPSTEEWIKKTRCICTVE